MYEKRGGNAEENEPIEEVRENRFSNHWSPFIIFMQEIMSCVDACLFIQQNVCQLRKKLKCDSKEIVTACFINEPSFILFSF
jgi:hypothetical protein